MRLERFGSLSLSQIDSEDTLSTPTAISGLVDTVGGALDAWGIEDARTGPYVISRTFAVHGSTPALMDSAAGDVRAQVGKRARLYARMGDDTVRWTYARMMSVQQVRTRRNFNFQPLRCDFELIDGRWRGHDHTTWTLDDGKHLDSGLYLDDAGFTETMASSPHTITVENGGNRRVDNARITIVAGSSAITALTIAKTGETDIDYIGVISTGHAFVLDCGAYSVTDNGVSDYANLSLGSNHEIAEWLRLDPGENDIVITYTGGGTGSTVTIEFADGWA